MIRFLIRAGIFLGSAAIGLFVAKLVVNGMTITRASFLFVVVIFAVIQSVIAPFLSQQAQRGAPVLTGAVGLASTFIALLVTDAISDGLTITGVSSWLLATLIVWLATMLATLLLPWILVRAGVQRVRAERS